MRIPLKQTAAILSIVFSCPFSAFAAGPVVEYDDAAGGVRLVRKSDVEGKVPSRFEVQARGESDVLKVYASVAGVLFQGMAKPDAALREKPIRLGFKTTGKHDAALRVTFGDKTVTSTSPAWVWAIAARFALHDATAAVTMLDKPPSPAAATFEAKWHAGNRVRKRLVWVKYHPVLDDTVIGFYLFAADAFIGDPALMRRLPNGLKGLEYGDSTSLRFDNARSRTAAGTLDRIISLKAKTGDVAMLNDLGDSFVFKTIDGRLQITGVPNYRFARKDRAGKFRQLKTLSKLCSNNRHHFRRANPRLEAAVTDFSRLVAFFNHVGEAQPKELKRFVGTLKPVLERIPAMQTPIAVPLRVR